MRLTCVLCTFRFILKFVLIGLFLKSLLLNMQNNEKNYERAESEETKKNKKFIVSIKK